MNRVSAAAAALCLLCIARLAFAEPEPGVPDMTPITPQAFREYAEGWTLHFERDGTPFGSERFAEGGEVLWRSGDGTCVEGAWRAYGAQVCFLYEGEPEVLCWRMFRDGEAMVARLLGDGPDAGMELRVIRRDRAPLLCGGEGQDL